MTPTVASLVAGSGQKVTFHAETSYAGTLLWALEPGLLWGSLDAASATDVTYTAPDGLVTHDADVVLTATAGAVSDFATITVHPTILEVTGPATVRAGGAAVEFRLVTAIGASVVAWSVTPSSVGTISGAGAAATFTPAATAAADAPFDVVATIGQATGSAAATLLAQRGPGTVSGVVVDEQGVGYAGARVVLGGSSVLSGAGGSFTFPDVTPPYDVMVIADGTWTVTSFRGVSDLTPVLRFTRSPSSSYQVATVTGLVTLDGAAQDAFVFGPLSATWASSSSGYSLSSHWYGDPSATLTHRAVVQGYDPVAGDVAYWYGSRPVALIANKTSAHQDIAIQQVESGRVTGTVALGAEHDASTLRFRMTPYFTDGTSRTVFTTSAPGVSPGPFSGVVPVLPGAIVRIGYDADGVSGGGAGATASVVPGQVGVGLTLPAIPVAIAPADNASKVGYGTTFTWTAGETGGMDGVSITCGFTAFEILGGGRTATIPDLSGFGVSVSSGTSCTWTPRWYSFTVDEMVRGPAAVNALGIERHGDGQGRSFKF